MSETIRACELCGGDTRRPKERYCSACYSQKLASEQAARGETCAGCDRPPGRAPLRGQKTFGAKYCFGCYKRKKRGQPVGPEYIKISGNPEHRPIPEHVTEANRRALAYWLARNYRTRERQAA